MKFIKKKSVVIDAVQWFPGVAIEGLWWPGVGTVDGATQDQVNAIMAEIDRPKLPRITTLEGDLIVTSGDWIITGIKGEKYPCKPDIFAATYEPAEAPSSPSDKAGQEAG